jgi:hypothetical protein
MLTFFFGPIILMVPSTPQMVICLLETTLFYHHLRVTNTVVSHPTTRYGTGLIANWADNVTFAASAPHIPTGVASSATLSSLELVTNASVTRTDSPRFTVYQPRGLELDNKDEILAYIDSDMTGPTTHVSCFIIAYCFL